MTIADTIAKAHEERRIGYSFEYFPPKTETGLANLFDRMSRMVDLRPAFVSCTWGAGGSTYQNTIEICSTAQNMDGIDTLMHLTCTNMERDQLDAALQDAKDAGIRNILALRGDPPRGQEYWTSCDNEFVHAIDLVRYIRQKYGDTFCVGVAGYPEGHMDAENKQADLEHLKAKVDAGADFIISQLFYDTDVFVDWVATCRKAGIHVPIVAGIMPFQSYQSFRRMVHLCRVRVPPSILSTLEQLRGDDQKVKDFGIDLAVDMIQRLSTQGIFHFHISTLNLERSTRLILEQMGLAPKEETTQGIDKRLDTLSAAKPTPARKSVLDQHQAEQWDEFPNGRYGDARSPAFGQVPYSAGQILPTAEASQKWGFPVTESDVTDLFVKYIKGDIISLPWCDEELETETYTIRKTLMDINRRGYWTVSSQPAVNGVPSDDPIYGWGPKGGYVYQKAFIECFVASEQLDALLQRLRRETSITFCATNQKGDYRTNMTGEDPHNAMTWGVFPGKEIVQPTMIDMANFMAWKDEAYALWTEWSQQYDQRSPSAKLLQTIGEDCWLVNVVHNDFQRPERLFEVMLE